MILALLSALTIVAGCKIDSAGEKQPATLVGSLAALHVDAGGASVPVNDATVGMSESRLVIAICAWPSYSFAVSSAVSNGPSPTAYVVPGTNGFRPDLFVNVIGWEIQKRWRDSAVFHPIALFGAGTVRARYRYTLNTPNGRWDDSMERTGLATYYMPAAGIEASVFRYVSVYALLGVRYAKEMTLPGLGKGAFSGRYATIGMGFGKFR